MSEETKTEEKTAQAAAPMTPAGQSKMVKYVIIAVVVLVVLGYGVRYVMGMMAVGVMNADLKANGIEVTGNPAAGNATYNYKDEKGNTATIGVGTKLPDDFPKSTPVYDGTIMANTSSVENGKKMFMVSIQTKDGFDKVTQFYKDRLSTGGWKISQEANVAAGYTMFVADNGTQQTSVMIQSAQDNANTMTTVTLTTGEKVQ